jgi:ABC-type Zn uptake system ZnuABC Zn-binding protein ZnuA
VAKISDSTLLIVNGADYEHSLESIIDNADGQRRIITASKRLEAVERTEEIDPHFWVNPQFTISYVENIRDGLIQADPGGADLYNANAEAYVAQLRNLDTWAERHISALPPERRLLVTSHDALGYFAERYGLNVAGVIIPSISDEAGTAASQMAAVIEIIRTSATGDLSG